MKGKRLFAYGMVFALTGCLSLPRNDRDGFTWFDGTISKEAPSDCFILRYEAPDGVLTNTVCRRGMTKWAFVEIRQLGDRAIVIKDGVMRPLENRVPACNWHKLLDQGARNVRIKFVDAGYALAEDGRRDAPGGFVSLFNGRDLTGWKGVTREERFNWPGVRRAAVPEKRWDMQAKADEKMRAHWHVHDGVLAFDGLPGGDSIATVRDFGNFEMLVDWRLLSTHGDTGFFLRGLPQVQIWDPDEWSGQGSCGLWNNREAQSGAACCADNPIGDWNRCRIRMVGDRVSVWLNGRQVVDDVRFENTRQPGAPIPLIDQVELQCHGDPVEFRNIFIRELPEADEDIPDPSAAERGERVDLLKDGMAGWLAADPKLTMGWSVKDGVLSNFVTKDPTKTSRGGSGGTHLVTKRTDFYDFDLSYDVLVPAKCNSGVYLRGRYEIQVCDSYGRKTDAHTMAALYDLIAPAVAAEKPAGEWQHVDLTLYRRHLTVSLNGVKIIDNKPVAGVTPAAMDWDETVPGPILLQGDHSNASFRNMILTKIIR